MLIQGLSLPTPSVCTTQPVPPARQRSSPPPIPTNPHPLLEPVDTTGRACVRGSCSQSTPVPFSIQTQPPMTATTPAFKQASLAPTQVVEVEVTTIPRTTAWRQRKKIPESQSQAPLRRRYTCHVCGEAMTAVGHTQFYRKHYCPNAPGQIPKEEWLAARRAEKKARNC